MKAKQQNLNWPEISIFGADKGMDNYFFEGRE